MLETWQTAPRGTDNESQFHDDDGADEFYRTDREKFHVSL